MGLSLKPLLPVLDKERVFAGSLLLTQSFLSDTVPHFNALFRFTLNVGFPAPTTLPMRRRFHVELVALTADLARLLTALGIFALLLFGTQFSGLRRPGFLDPAELLSGRVGEQKDFKLAFACV